VDEIMTARLESRGHSLEISVRDWASKRRASEPHGQFDELRRSLERVGIRVSEEGADDYSANDLDVHIDGGDGTSHWIMDGGFMMTWEIRRLAEWLQLVAGGAIPKWSCSGVDGYPEFSLSDDRAWLEITVQQWGLRSSETTSGEEMWGELRFRFDAAKFIEFAEALEREVASFPIRPVQPDGPATQELARFRLRLDERDLPMSFVSGPTGGSPA
jgi:hypothetical protein